MVLHFNYTSHMLPYHSSIYVQYESLLKYKHHDLLNSCINSYNNITLPFFFVFLMPKGEKIVPSIMRIQKSPILSTMTIYRIAGNFERVQNFVYFV